MSPDDHKTYGEAMNDPTSRLRQIADRTAQEREQVIGEWMSLGYTREEAYKAALFGYRK